MYPLPWLVVVICLAIIIVWIQFCPFCVGSTHVNQATDSATCSPYREMLTLRNLP